MAAPKLVIAVICSVALGATVAAAFWEQGRQEKSGRIALHARATRFAEALEDAALGGRVAAMASWLEPAERTSARARAVLDELAATTRRRLILVLAKVRLGEGGRRGQAEYLVTSPDRERAGGTVLVDWTRGADGTWFLDLVDS